MRAIVTGAAGGIGKALTRALLRDGHHVFAVDIDEASLRTILAYAEPDRIAVQQLDVREAAAWHSLMERVIGRYGGIDVLFNIAGYLRPGYAYEANAEDLARHLDINVKGTVLGVQAVLPHMLARGNGHIVNMASLAALSPIPGLALYAMSKFAVRGYSLSIAHELKDSGIAVTTVCPDAVQTPMLDLQRDFPQAALTFSGTVLSPDDVVRAIMKALRKRPLEVILPRRRGWMAKLANAWPALGMWFGGGLIKKGLRRQKQ